MESGGSASEIEYPEARFLEQGSQVSVVCDPSLCVSKVARAEQGRPEQRQPGESEQSRAEQSRARLNVLRVSPSLSVD